MNKIISIIIGMSIIYSITVIIPVYCADYIVFGENICYWFYNHPVISYGALVILLIALGRLVKLIGKRG
jgi:hypothetical protein